MFPCVGMSAFARRRSGGVIGDVRNVSVENRPRASVVIAAYNAASFLERAVASALRQTLVDIEVLVVDDCSTDDTLAVAKALAAKDPRVRPLQTLRNSGPSVARNVGIEHARGDWIAVLDADDAFVERRLQTLVQLGEDAGADIVADNFLFYSVAERRNLDAGLAESDETEELTLHRFLRGARPGAQEADYGLLKPIFRAQFLKHTGVRYPTHSRHGEDFLLIIDCLSRGAKYVLSRRPGYLYTTRDSTQSRTVIDYEGVLAQSAALRGRSEIARDATALGLLEDRISAIRRLAAERQLHHSIGERDVRGVFELCLRNPHALPAALRWGLQKVTARATPATA